MIGTLMTALAGGLLAPTAPPSAGTEAPAKLAVYADVVHTSTGESFENAAVVMADGKIVAITPGASAPKDAPRAKAITAGMIDLSLRIDSGELSVEQSHEISPDMRVAQTLDPFDEGWARALRSGVTTALAFPPDRDVIGGLGVVLKTGGAPSIPGRTVKADAALRGSMGTEPSQGNHPAYRQPDDFYSRRPTTRMGVEWEWRKAFYDAVAAKDDPARAFPGHERLLQALRGELPVFIQAWATQDIRTAVFLKEELQREGFGELTLVIDAGAEAWREPELLTRTHTAVVLPPFDHDGRTRDGAFMAWDVAKRLHDAGVQVALSSHNSRDVADRLGLQAAYARRGGLSFEEALEAVTIVPARLAGVADRVGSLAVGKDADLVLWSGEPFEASSRVIGVVLDGELVVDPAAGAE